MDVSFLYDHLGEIDCQSKYKFVTDSVQINVCGKCDLDLAEAKTELRGTEIISGAGTGREISGQGSRQLTAEEMSELNKILFKITKRFLHNTAS